MSNLSLCYALFTFSIIGLLMGAPHIVAMGYFISAIIVGCTHDIIKAIDRTKV